MVNAAACPQGHNIIAHAVDVNDALSLMNILWQTGLFVPDSNIDLKYQNEDKAFHCSTECLERGSLGKRVCMWSASEEHDSPMCSLFMHKTMDVNCCVTSVNLFKKSWHLDPLIHATKMVLW